MKKLLDLIHIDLITMNGGKNNIRTIIILIFIFFGVVGFLFSPVIGLECPVFIGCLFVPMLFKNEAKYHSEKLNSVLPINRSDLVNSRFLLTTGLYIVLSFIFYLLMLLALIIKPYYLILGEIADFVDVIKIMTNSTGNAFSEFGLFNLLYFGTFSFGLIVSSSSLRKYFKDNTSFSTKIKKADKKEFTLGIFVLVIVLLWILIASGVIPIGTALLPILQIVTKLAKVANGFLLGVVMLTIAVFTVIYHYICTTLEYNEKEL